MTIIWSSWRAAVPLPPPRDAGHLDARNLRLTELRRNVIRTVQLEEMITRRNRWNGNRDQSESGWRCPEESENFADCRVCLRAPCHWTESEPWTSNVFPSKWRSAAAGHHRNQGSWKVSPTAKQLHVPYLRNKSSVNNFGWFVNKKGMVKYDFFPVIKTISSGLP